MSIRQNNANIVSTCSQRIAALTKLVDPKTPMKISGKPTTLAGVLAVYQACVDARSELAALRAAFDKALEARDDADIARQATDKGLASWVDTELGAGSQAAQELGFLPRKTGVKSADTKAKAVEKLLATRKARQTMGKRQRAKVKGTVEVPARDGASSPDGSAATS